MRKINSPSPKASTKASPMSNRDTLLTFSKAIPHRKVGAILPEVI